MRALITGIGGFVGGHLASLLLREGFEVWGMDRLPVSGDIANRAVAIELGDICDPVFTNRVVNDARPTHVFHLAWEFEPGRAGRSEAPNRNLLGLTVLLEAIHGSASHAQVMIASSSAVYGAPGRQRITEKAPQVPPTASETGPRVPEPQPIDEDAPLNPANAYGISKVAIETVAASFRATRGMNIVVARTFNLIGPGMPRRLFAGSLAVQIAAAERNGPGTIKVGRLDSSRDYIDVRDAVRAYLALVSQPAQEPWIFNVCAGVSHSCREIADEMMALAAVPVTLDHDATRLQSGDIDYQQGSAARLRRAAGWAPMIAFPESVRDTLEHARHGGM